jgi:hypothetical protein
LAEALRASNAGSTTLIQDPQPAYTGDRPEWMSQTAPQFGDEPFEHDQVPATEARYAESAEQEATRAARIAGYQPRQGHDTGLVEMVLVYPLEDRNEAARLVAAARDVLGPDLKAAEVILRALRVLAAVLDNREAPSVSLAQIARVAGWLHDDA